MTRGIPGLRGGDHVGITVPDMAQAHEFFVDVLGCEFVYSLPEMRHGDDWMREHLNVDPRRVVREIRFYRCGFGLNFEVFEYEPHEGQRAQPRNSDIGGHHVALYVDDMDAADAYLKEKGIRLLAGPVASKNASAGQRWHYFLSPWGMQFELVSYPGGKAYEKDAPGGRSGSVGGGSTVRLWHPARPAE
jgi:glyoxylase I family protein